MRLPTSSLLQTTPARDWAPCRPQKASAAGVAPKSRARDHIADKPENAAGKCKTPMSPAALTTEMAPRLVEMVQREAGWDIIGDCKSNESRAVHSQVRTGPQKSWITSFDNSSGCPRRVGDRQGQESPLALDLHDAVHRRDHRPSNCLDHALVTSSTGRRTPDREACDRPVRRPGVQGRRPSVIRRSDRVLDSPVGERPLSAELHFVPHAFP